jgi:hypothetical protein
MTPSFPSLEALVERGRAAIAARLGDRPDARRVEFDSDLPVARNAHGLFDPGTRVVYLGPERTASLRRLVFGGEPTEKTTAALVTLVHELLHSVSPVLRHPPAELAAAQSAGWAFWEEGLVAWWAEKVVRQELLEHAPSGFWQGVEHPYAEEAQRIEWLERRFGVDVVGQIWRQPTTSQRIAVANRYLGDWLYGILLHNGMTEEDAVELVSALGWHMWELLQRGYHLLLPRMDAQSADAFLRGSFGLGR